MSTEFSFASVSDELRRHGLLLESDALFPSVVGLAVGEPVRGSWWGHARGNEIYQVTLELGHHADVCVTKLISGKVTYVHRRLWPALLTVAMSHEAWQLDRLTELDALLLDLVRQNEEASTPQSALALNAGGRAIGDSARRLERRLLVHGVEVHGPTGAHEKRLETWERWGVHAALKPGHFTIEAAKRTLEEALVALADDPESTKRLPWSS